MKKFNILFVIGVLFLATAFIVSSGCKKKDDPAPTPSAPTFLMSSTPDPNDATRVYFLFKCLSDNVKLTSIIITDPLALFSDTYDLQNASYLVNQAYIFGDPYTKESGTWTFKFTGNRQTDNTGFVAVATLSQSK